uniref:Photosystem I reaction center subunit VIII n=1 Tax=Chaetoceros debilis TaxID=122233 RepID=A0A7S3Q6M2_9STRA|mmetsp:Transcript_25027/g.37014  ORF Transcript_25027/g.37014 Transcript_25027/m.37014 type:complete len:128 (-) Transcript_25027:424-807(-)
MKSFTAILLIIAVSLFGADAFSVNNNNKSAIKPFTLESAASTSPSAFPKQLMISSALATFVSTYGPAIAAAKAKEVELPPDYIGKEMAASFLPAIFVPVVGLVFPAFSMALFFLYTQKDDIEAPGSF